MKPQTLQLQGLNIDPTKLTVVQELPDVGKVVIQDPGRLPNDSISNILEEMKSEEVAGQSVGTLLRTWIGSTTLSSPSISYITAATANPTPGGLEFATAIPVAVTTLDGDPKRATIKRMPPLPNTIALPAAKKGSRNIIFAGNTLPQGAIPIQISGLNTLPISAVKSIPLPVNLSSLTPTSAPVLTTATLPQVVAAKKSRVEVVNATPPVPQPRATIPITLPTATAITSPSTNNKANNNISPIKNPPITKPVIITE